MNRIDYPEDCQRIQRVLRDRLGVEATLKECEELWHMYSDDMCAGWMMTRSDDNVELEMRRLFDEGRVKLEGGRKPIPRGILEHRKSLG